MRYVVGFAAGRGSDVGIILEMYACKKDEIEGISGSRKTLSTSRIMRESGICM